MKVARVLMTLVFGLALIGAGLPVRAFMSGAAADRGNSAMAAAGNTLALVAPDACASCDEGPCPLSQAECNAPCALAAPVMALPAAGGVVALAPVQDRCDADCRLAEGRAPPPDPFPPRC